MIKQVTLLLLFNLFLFSSVFAGKRYTWDGSSDSSWTVAANWTPGGGAPANPAGGTAADFIINGAYAAAPVITSSPLGFNIQDCQISGNSLVQVRGGTVTFNGDVGVFGGSDLIISGGTVNITGSLYIFDGGSTITVSGGTLNVTQEIIFGNNGPATDGPNGATNITMTSGSISASDIAFDNLTGDTHTLNVSGGSVTLSGDIRSDGADVIINLTGNGAMSLDDLLMTGGSDLITMSSTGVLALRGDWNNSGTSNLTNGRIDFTTAAPHSITNANGSESFYFLRLNGATTTTLNDSIIIKNRLQLFAGHVIDGNGNSVTINDNVIVNTGGTGYIDGPINKIGNDAFTFPTGNGIFNNPISISAPNTTLAMFRAQYFRTNPDGLYPLANREAGIATASQLEYWQLDRLVSTSPAIVTLNWDATSLVGNLTDLRVVKWDGTTSEWKNQGNGGTTGTTSAGTIQSSGNITTFSPFTLGSSSLSNPLPVELINFNATPLGDQIAINWSTAAEINNNYFEIQKTVDGKDIKTIATVNSKAVGGNSTEKLYYSFHDPIDFDKSAYYRLIQFDHDGTSKEYPFIAVNLINSRSQNSEKPLVIPNPTFEREFSIRYQTESTIELFLFGMNGQQINISQQKLNDTTIRVKINEEVNTGIYFLHIVDREKGETISSEKIILQ